MAINFKTSGYHHICLRCTDMNVSKNFYRDMLGFTLAMDSPDLFIVVAGPAIIAFKKADKEYKKDVFSPFNIGLDHIALACETAEELHRAAAALTEAGIENTGVKLDETLQKQYVAFKDPDRIQWEFYMV